MSDFFNEALKGGLDSLTADQLEELIIMAQAKRSESKNDKEGYNSVGANTTLVVYCKVKDPNKYSKGQNVTITGTANCYTYAVVIEE